jgi:hypothetical protein
MHQHTPMKVKLTHLPSKVIFMAGHPRLLTLLIIAHQMILLPKNCALIFHGWDRMHTQVISEEIPTSVTLLKYQTFE